MTRFDESRCQDDTSCIMKHHETSWNVMTLTHQSVALCSTNFASCNLNTFEPYPTWLQESESQACSLKHMKTLVTNKNAEGRLCQELQ